MRVNLRTSNKLNKSVRLGNYSVDIWLKHDGTIECIKVFRFPLLWGAPMQLAMWEF